MATGSRRLFTIVFTIVHYMIYSIFIIECFIVSVGGRDDNIAYLGGSQPAFAFGRQGRARYLLYEVNPGEGFNLRRDVYMRIANLVKVLNDDASSWWTLVLPPWSRLYHWRSNVPQQQIPWETFFDIDSLSRHVPVMEFVDFLNVSNREIDEIYYLQNYKEGWTDGKWEEKMDERKCIEKTGFVQDVDNSWHWWFWDYEDVSGKSFKCISVQAQSTYLKHLLTEVTTARSVFLVRAEQLIHGSYSEWSPEFWTARRSMRFAKHLRDIGDNFRHLHLDSDDTRDRTLLFEDWRKMERQHGDAIGGPYVAVHLRRRDFLYSHSDKVPSLKSAAGQIRSALAQYNLTSVFVATDAPAEEVKQLRESLAEFSVHQFEPTLDVVKKYKDGGVAIIDQWICAHARHFIGTALSTLSFRIHEEREILGFDPKTTFNCFCADENKNCEQPSKWVVVYN